MVERVVGGMSDEEPERPCPEAPLDLAGVAGRIAAT